MKQIFRCEYCDEIGTAEEIEKHEGECLHNYTKRSCFTCKHASHPTVLKYECKLGREIPSGQYMEQCGSHEWDNKEHGTRAWNSVFGSLFGGI